MLENRETMLQLFPELFTINSVSPISNYPALLHQSLAESAPTWVDSNPKIAILTPGTFNSAYYEHSFLADKMGIELVNFRVRSRAAPETEMLLKLPELFSSIQHPTLLHCKSGADRAGLMSALYVLIVMKQPAIEALKQLSFKYLHVKQAKTGILDAFIASYIPFESQGMEFMRWVEEVYEPEKLVQEFKAQPLATRFVDSILKRE